jgi:uncharacterized membrane protein
MTEDGTCSDFAWGFLLGFLFPFPFVVMILLCRTKKLAKTGLLLGYIAKIYLNITNFSSYG